MTRKSSGRDLRNILSKHALPVVLDMDAVLKKNK